MTDGAVREEWESIADRLIDGARARFAPDGSGVSFEGPRASDNGPAIDRLEGFARSLWLAACRIPHAPPARAAEIEADFLTGLVSGPQSWPDPQQPQTMVESASIAFALWASGGRLWAALDGGERLRLGEYLLRAVDRPISSGNWVLFRVLTHAVLRHYGWPIPSTPTEQALDLVDSHYRGHGWYTDGGDAVSARFDYYNAWSFHTYPLIWALIEGDRTDPARTAAYRERSREFVPRLARLIGADGAPLYQGRSLVYRAGMTAPFWAAELAGAEPPEGLALEASTAVLRWFDRGGAFSDGRATMGWRREFPSMAQGYSGPGSPLWLSKAFIGLLLAADHPAWSTPTGGHPARDDESAHLEVEPGWLVSRADGIVRIANHGTGRRPEEIDPHSAHLRDDPFYSRLAFSSATAPLVDLARHGEPAGPADNSIILRDDEGRTTVRRPPRFLGGHGNAVASSCILEIPETAATIARATVVSAVRNGAEVRLVRFDRDVDAVDLCGWAVSASAVETRVVGAIADAVAGDLRSELGAPGAELRVAPAGATAFGEVTGLPIATFGPVRAGIWIWVVVRLSIGPMPLELPGVVIGNDRVDVAWADGAADRILLAELGIDEEAIA